jgi:N-acetylneuraminic acid mutarotase
MLPSTRLSDAFREGDVRLPLMEGLEQRTLWSGDVVGAIVPWMVDPVAVGAPAVMAAPPPAVVTGAVAAQTLTWSSLPSVPLGRSEAMGAAVNAKFYIFGGYFQVRPVVPSAQVHCFDPVANRWTRKADMPVALSHAGVAVDGKYIYFAGGYPPNARGTFQAYGTTAVRRYDTETDTWSSMRSLPQMRATGQLVLVGRELHYISGTDIQRNDRNEHWALNIDDANANWVTRAPIPTARNHFGSALFNGKVYCIGGAKKQDAAETALATVEIYDPATNTWSRGKSMPTPRALIMSGVTVHNGRIIVAGGETHFNGATRQVTSYNPATNTWTQLQQLPSARIAGILVSMNGSLMFTTGYLWTAPNGFSYTAWKGVFN